MRYISTSSKDKPCTKCREIKSLSAFWVDCRSGRPQSWCKPCTNHYASQWHKSHPASVLTAVKKYRVAHPDRHKAARAKTSKKRRLNGKSREYERRWMAGNLMARLSKRLRNRTRQAFTRRKWWKASRSESLLGCNFDIAKQWLESKFVEGMSWGNMGEWHIDHIKPLASAKTLEELIMLCHYTNLQPLWKYDNWSKGARYIGSPEQPQVFARMG